MPNYVTQSYKQGNFYDAVSQQKINVCRLVAALNSTYAELIPLMSYGVVDNTTTGTFYLFNYNTLFTYSNSAGNLAVLSPVTNSSIVGHSFCVWGSNQTGAQANATITAYNNLGVSQAVIFNGLSYSTSGTTFGRGFAYGAKYVAISTGYVSIFPFCFYSGKGSNARTADTALASRSVGLLNTAPSASTTFAMTLNIPYVYPIFMGKETTIIIDFEVTTAGTLSNVVRAGILTSYFCPWLNETTFSGSYPFHVRSANVTVSTTTTGVKSVTLTSSQGNGWCYVVLVSQVGTACTVRGVGAKRCNGMIARTGTISSTTDYVGYTSATTVSGAFSTSLGAELAFATGIGIGRR